MKPKRTLSGGHQPVERTPKKTKQGNSVRSKPNHGRKKSIGQGK